MTADLDAVAIRAGREALVARRDLVGSELAGALASQADGWFARLGTALPPRWSLVAAGGYARGVLAPGGDVDVMLLHPPRVPDDDVRVVAEAIWYPVWDAGVKLSPAVHTVASARALAADELVTATTLLALRPLAGDPGPAAALAAAAAAQWRDHAVAWLERLRDASYERWRRSGEVSSRLEPNLKDGRGGLRDRDVLAWAVATGRGDVADALEGSLADLDEPAAVLLAARCELHRATGRASDVLLLADQDAVAAALGLADADGLMRGVSEAARHIDWVGERFWRRVGRVIDPPLWPGHRTPPLLDPNPAVEVEGDELHLSATADTDEPSLVFEVAAAAARSDIALSREALARLADETPAEPSRPWSERTRRAFVSLLAAGAPAVTTVEALEQYGLFSRYLPEWRHVRSLPQRNAFHVYNVDRHLLRTVAHAADLVRTVTRPDLLVVAALLHDIGKGYGRDHTEVGVELAATVTARMGFDPDDTATVVALVRHHLLLAETATRRDLADPRTAANTAAALGALDRLGLLRALTEADSKATGPAAWSNWKAALIDRLTWSVAEVLRGRELPAEAGVEERFAPLLARARAHRALVVEHDAGPELVRLRVAGPDRAGLFATVAGVLVLHRVDVTAAEAWTTSDAIAVEQFHVLPAAAETPALDRVARDLEAAVGGGLDLAARLAPRVAAARRQHRRATAAASPRTEVVVSNEASDSTTMIDVRVPDGPAVLYQLAAALAGCGLNIRSAQIATLGHEVVDVFYVERPGPTGGQLPVGEHPAVRAAVLAAVADRTG